MQIVSRHAVPDVSRRWNMVNSKVVAQLPFVVCPQNSADQEIEWHDVAPCLFKHLAFSWIRRRSAMVKTWVNVSRLALESKALWQVLGGRHFYMDKVWWVQSDHCSLRFGSKS